MEADWEAEIGEGLPVIELPWSGYIDLRQNPKAIDSIDEAVRYPALAEALLRLNAADSAFLTAKCDVWLLNEPVDPYEFDASPEDAQAAMASYIDVVFRDAENAAAFGVYEGLAKEVVTSLRAAPGKNGRVDCILRTASLEGASGFGMTLYASGCGADAVAAEVHWKQVLRRAAEATIASALRNQAGE